MTEKEKKALSSFRELDLSEYFAEIRREKRFYGTIKNPDPAKQNPEFMKLVEEAKARRKKQ